MSDNVLQSLTNNVIFVKDERQSLRKLAKKITKVPDTIHIPSEYLVKRERERK